VWGTLSLGLFACGQYQSAGSSPTGVPMTDGTAGWALTGLFYGGGWKVLEAQCIGSLIICASTFACAMALFGVLNLFGILRISKDGEIEGMDLHEHGISAYPEYVVAPWAAPSGVPPELVNAGATAMARETSGHAAAGVGMSAV